jgi:hypothetical protein
MSPPRPLLTAGLKPLIELVLVRRRVLDSDGMESVSGAVLFIG